MTCTGTLSEPDSTGVSLVRGYLRYTYISLSVSIHVHKICVKIVYVRIYIYV